MNTENEKVVRTLFEQWWNDNCAYKTIFNYGYETIGQDIAYHAFKAALQSQVSNTSQDGSSEATRHATALEQCAIFAADVGDNIAKAMTDAAAYLRTVSTPPQQQEQSEEAIMPSGYCKDPNGRIVPTKEGYEHFSFGYDQGWKDGFQSIRTSVSEIEQRVRNNLSATPTATASQASREEQMVSLRTDESGNPTVWCDPEIADLVDALNTGSLATVASCSGHGHRPGRVSLADGRELLILNADQVEKVEALFPVDVNGAVQTKFIDVWKKYMPAPTTHEMNTYRWCETFWNEGRKLGNPE